MKSKDLKIGDFVKTRRAGYGFVVALGYGTKFRISGPDHVYVKRGGVVLAQPTGYSKQWKARNYMLGDLAGHASYEEFKQQAVNSQRKSDAAYEAGIQTRDAARQWAKKHFKLPALDREEEESVTKGIGWQVRDDVFRALCKKAGVPVPEPATAEDLLKGAA